MLFLLELGQVLALRRRLQQPLVLAVTVGVLHPHEGAKVADRLDPAIEDLLRGKSLEGCEVPLAEHGEVHPLVLHVHLEDSNAHRVALLDLLEGVHLRDVHEAGKVLLAHGDLRDVAEGLHFADDALEPLFLGPGLQDFEVGLILLRAHGEAELIRCHARLPARLAVQETDGDLLADRVVFLEALLGYVAVHLAHVAEAHGGSDALHRGFQDEAELQDLQHRDVDGGAVGHRQERGLGGGLVLAGLRICVAAGLRAALHQREAQPAGLRVDLDDIGLELLALEEGVVHELLRDKTLLDVADVHEAVARGPAVRWQRIHVQAVRRDARHDGGDQLMLRQAYEGRDILLRRLPRWRRGRRNRILIQVNRRLRAARGLRC
mmetsp:Transcript_158985/g.486544  ORF Transcript_158985/g.486544 Transcript_158985/m.486544 type:complete len:377 (+) Transcript_158985:372-1502(+)